VVWSGHGDERHLVRLIEVLYQGRWYRYLTNELDTERLPTPYAVALSVEMVYRSLYFFTSAFQRGAATEVVAYLAANAKVFGLLKQKRKRARPAPLQLLDLTNSAGP
jgi:hypothetical protein